MFFLYFGPQFICVIRRTRVPIGIDLHRVHVTAVIIRGRLSAYDNGALLDPCVGASGLRAKRKCFIVLNTSVLGSKTVFKMPVVPFVRFHTRLTRLTISTTVSFHTCYV